MTKEEVLKNINEKFADDILDVFDRSVRRVYIEIKAQSLVKVAVYVFKDMKARFNTASGVDARDHMEMLYHFTFDQISLVVSFRVKLGRENPEIDSLAPYFEGANWMERETRETLGINFKGHPDPRRLLLPEDWPQDVYPLRRDYKEWDKNAIRDRGV